MGKHAGRCPNQGSTEGFFESRRVPYRIQGFQSQRCRILLGRGITS
jgi:hypothetical protein